MKYSACTNFSFYILESKARKSGAYGQHFTSTSMCYSSFLLIYVFLHSLCYYLPKTFPWSLHPSSSIFCPPFLHSCFSFNFPVAFHHIFPFTYSIIFSLSHIPSYFPCHIFHHSFPLLIFLLFHSSLSYVLCHSSSFSLCPLFSCHSLIFFILCSLPLFLLFLMSSLLLPLAILPYLSSFTFILSSPLDESIHNCILFHSSTFPVQSPSSINYLPSEASISLF